MKQLIYSTGIFENELIASEEKSHYAESLIAMRPQPKYELRKTSSCLSRYEVEDGDKEYLDQLRKDATEAILALNTNSITIKKCQSIFNRYKDFADIYNKAIHNFETECKNIQYIEIADSSDKGCYSLYRINDGVVQSEHPHKIGEPLVITIEKTSLQIN